MDSLFSSEACACSTERAEPSGVQGPALKVQALRLPLVQLPMPACLAGPETSKPWIQGALARMRGAAVREELARGPLHGISWAERLAILGRPNSCAGSDGPTAGSRGLCRSAALHPATAQTLHPQSCSGYTRAHREAGLALALNAAADEGARALLEVPQHPPGQLHQACTSAFRVQEPGLEGAGLSPWRPAVCWPRKQVQGWQATGAELCSGCTLRAAQGAQGKCAALLAGPEW